MEHCFSNLAVQTNHLGNFKLYWWLGPTPRDSDLIEMRWVLGTGTFKNVPGILTRNKNRIAVWGHSSFSTPDLRSGVGCPELGWGSLISVATPLPTEPINWSGSVTSQGTWIVSGLQTLCTPPKPLWYFGVPSSTGKSPSSSPGAGHSLSRIAEFPAPSRWYLVPEASLNQRRGGTSLPEVTHVLPLEPSGEAGNVIVFCEKLGSPWALRSVPGSGKWPMTSEFNVALIMASPFQRRSLEAASRLPVFSVRSHSQGPGGSGLWVRAFCLGPRSSE